MEKGKKYQLGEESVLCIGDSLEEKSLVRFIYPLNSACGRAMVTITVPKRNIELKEGSMSVKNPNEETTVLTWETMSGFPDKNYSELLKKYNYAI